MPPSATTRPARASAPSAVLLAGVCAAGALGGLPSAAGPFDVLALCGWLATIGVGGGWLLGASGVRLLQALAAPAAWALCLVLVQARGERSLAAPLDAMGVVLGFFLCGWGLGRLAGRPYAGAGAALLASLVLSGLAPLGGLPGDPRGARAGLASTGAGDGGPRSLGAQHPVLARVLLEASPLVLVLESAGQDPTHANPRLYRSSGIEWFQRRPWQGRLAASAALVVGCLFAALAAAFGRARPREPAA